MTQRDESFFRVGSGLQRTRTGRPLRVEHLEDRTLLAANSIGLESVAASLSQPDLLGAAAAELPSPTAVEPSLALGQPAASGSGSTISSTKSTVSETTGLNRPTSLQFGPDGRLYVSQQDGLIRAYTLARDAADDYSVIAEEVITDIQGITNHNDSGQEETTINTRLVTGLLVAGTAQNPVLYVGSSDPRIGGGNDGEDLNLDTNSGTITRLTWNGATWDALDLVRGLPRSEENHANNGMQLDSATNLLYVAMGGNTNMGAPSNNFALLPEYALSAAILQIDLTAIGETTYDLPTLDDDDQPGVDSTDPFGGNDGKNQAILVPGGPVQVYAPGFRNPYDLVITSAGRFYSIDNGPNAGWGDVPIGEGPAGLATNAVSEPGLTKQDGLHFITGPGYYGGHPNPTRSNPANTFNPLNPQSPVSAPNVIESDYLAPGVEDGSLATFGSSTNGITEYTSGNFSGELQGDLLAASFDNSIQRIKLNAAGDAVLLSEALFSNVGFRPLDVTTASTGPWAGSIWVVDVALDRLIVFDPSDSICGTAGDADCDGYTDDDEIANGTDPFNPADLPSDWDADFISDLIDPDDDNDTQLDTEDPFAIDPHNGAMTDIGVLYTWENDAPSAGGLLGLGFTGLMTNQVDDYQSLFDPEAVTAGGAAGVFTVDSASSGTARGVTNTQTQALQFGVHVADATQPYEAITRLLGPFNGLTPAPGQEMGLVIGTGDQDNYIQLVVTGNGGGAIELMSEIGGVDTLLATQAITLPGPSSLELFLTIDPVTSLLQASYSSEGGTRVDLGGAVAVPASWLAGSLALGLIATDPTGGGALPVTWDYLGVVPALPQPIPRAEITINAGGNFLKSSTFASGSFQITNSSPGSQRITSVTFDISTSLLRDQVFDPDGLAGDVVGKAFTPDSGASLTGQLTHLYSSPHDLGFDRLEVTFDDFDPGETFTFSLDIDPTTVQGAPQPGPQNSASASGFELSGTTVTVTFDDATTFTRQTSIIPGSKTGSHLVAESPALAAPNVVVVDAPVSSRVVTEASQTARITGEVGATVRLHVVEAALYLNTVPGGGFDVDPFEANQAISIVQHTATIGATGMVDIPIQLTRSDGEGGYNHIVAVLEDSAGSVSDPSPVRVLKLHEFPPQPNVLYRINSGGPLLTDVPIWEEDSQLNPSQFVNLPEGNSVASSTPTAIDLSNATVPDGTPTHLLQTQRRDPGGGGEMIWSFPVDPGNYEVRLYFSDNRMGNPAIGTRVFDVEIEGLLLLDDFDIVAEVGTFTGIVKSFLVASDASLEIEFLKGLQSPVVSAIEILCIPGDSCPIPGDYNADGSVDLHDYTRWRDTLASTTDLRADGDANGLVDSDDYDVWKQNFGSSAASSGVATISSTPSETGTRSGTRCAG